MKKHLVLVMILSFTLILAACSGKSEQVEVTEKFLNEMAVKGDEEAASKYLSK